MHKFLMLKVQSLKLKVQSVQKNVQRLYIFPFFFSFLFTPFKAACSQARFTLFMENYGT